MGTSVKGRSFVSQQTHYIRKRVTAAKVPASTPYLIGTLPAGSMFFGDSVVQVVTAFTDNHSLKLGSSGDDDFIGGTITLATGKRELTSGAYNPLTADLDIYAKLTSQSTAGAVGVAAGEFEVIISYVPNNDDLENSTQYDAN